MSIQEHLNKIRNAIYGREVRESIAKGIETAYDDASEKDNANMEVKLARGTNPNLNTRLNKMDETDRQNVGKIDSNYNEVTAQLAHKATKTELEVEKQRIDSFTKLEDGTTTGDAELIDGRIGVNGKIHDNIGGAIRGQVSNVDNKADLAIDLIVDGNSSIDSSFLNWSIGSVNVNTGEVMESPKNRMLGVEFYTPRRYDVSIVAHPDYEFVLYRYNMDESYIGRLEDDFIQQISLEAGYKYRFVARKKDDTEFTQVPKGVLIFNYDTQSDKTKIVSDYKIENHYYGAGPTLNEYPGWNVYYFNVKPLELYEYRGYIDTGNTPRIAFMNDDTFISTVRPKLGINILSIPHNANRVGFPIRTNNERSFRLYPLAKTDSQKTVEALEVINDKVNVLSDMLAKGKAEVVGTFMEWVIGSILFDNGNISENFPNRIATMDFYEPNDLDSYVEAKEGYGVLSYQYDLEGNYLGRVNHSLQPTVQLEVGYKYKLVVGKDDNTSFDQPVTDVLTFVYQTGIARDNKPVERFPVDKLPNTETNALAFSTSTGHASDNDYTGLTWSDGIVWRWVNDNKLAISATGYATMKVEDGELLFSNETNTPRESVSVTKLLSALVAVDYIENYNETVTLTGFDIVATHLDWFLLEGDVVDYETILNASIVVSDNNAAASLERLIGYKIKPDAITDDEAKTAFFNKMEEKANEIGMSNASNFKEAWTGLQASPLDLVKMLRYIQLNVPKIKEIWGKLSYEVNVIRDGELRTWTIDSTTSASNRNLLPEFRGGKTGSGAHIGAYALIWEHKETGELYASAVTNSNITYNQRHLNTRRIIDEVYSSEL